MASMKWLKIVSLLLVIQLSKQEPSEVDCSSKVNCDTSVAAIAKVACTKGFQENPVPKCTCESGTACADILALELDYTTLNDDKCSELCKDNTENMCAFWKYTNIVESLPRTTNCFLMAELECASIDQQMECPKYHGDVDPADPNAKTKCFSDKVEGDEFFKCTDGTDNPSPSGVTCPGPIIAEDDQKKYAQKWKCFDDDLQDVTDDMYGNNEATNKMPLNGFCKLMMRKGENKSCKETDPEFRYECKEDPDNSQAGKWVPADGVVDSDDVIDGTTKQLKDVTCTAPDLKFTNENLATQPGREIICTKGGITHDTENGNDEYVIYAENYCHMYCDDFDILSFRTNWIEGALRADQKRGWFYQVSGENPETMANADILDCWGKRF